MPTIEQLKAEYDGEWLAILVTASDIYGATEGELFHHSKDRSDIARKILEIPPHERKDYDIKICYAGPPLPEGIDGMLISVWATTEQMASLSSKIRE